MNQILFLWGIKVKNLKLPYLFPWNPYILDLNEVLRRSRILHLFACWNLVKIFLNAIKYWSLHNSIWTHSNHWTFLKLYTALFYKLGVNRVCILNQPLVSNKLRIFNVASRSIMFYGPQILGYKMHDDVEKFLRYFI